MFEDILQGIDPSTLFFIAGLLIVSIIGYVILSAMGVRIPLDKIFHKSNEDEKKMKAIIVGLPDDRKPRIISRTSGFDVIVDDIIIASKDEKTGMNRLRFKYGDELSSFEIPDSPLNIRFVGSFVDFLVKDRRMTFEIIEGDALTNMKYQKVSSEMQIKSVLKENETLKQSHKEMANEWAQTYNSVRKGMYGLYGGQQSYGGGGSPFLRSWRSPYALGSPGEMEGQGEQEQM